MTPLAPLVTAFFGKHLAAEKGVSKNTIASYSYTFRFLCRYASNRLAKAPSALCLEDLDVRTIRDSRVSGTRLQQLAPDQKPTSDCHPLVHEVCRVRSPLGTGSGPFRPGK